jgi:hypothetical protein
MTMKHAIEIAMQQWMMADIVQQQKRKGIGKGEASNFFLRRHESIRRGGCIALGFKSCSVPAA